MAPAAASSSRWCPTPEQLMILEEMYRGGVRTPNASQIQQITAHLSFYGRIEGKNVFYWFQNHKARDRQKLRRKLSKQIYQQQQQQFFHHQQGIILCNHHQHNHLQPNYLHNNNHLFFSSCLPPPPPSSALHQLSDHHSAAYLHQGGAKVAPVAQMTNCVWKTDFPPVPEDQSRNEIDHSVNKTNGHDWMMMTTTTSTTSEVGPLIIPTANCCNRPLKTLELFPITTTTTSSSSTTTSVKDHCEVSDPISCSTSTD